MLSICDAIAKMEGFGPPQNRATRNNNPGDIEWGDFAHAHGATRIEDVPAHGKARFAYFPTVDTGFNAMRALLLKHYRGLTIAQMLDKWAPPVENNESAYLGYVTKATGLAADTIIDQYV